MAEQRRYECPDMAAFLKRTFRAMTRRAAEGDLEALSALEGSRVELTYQLGESARALHAFGYSWTEIGRELGISRQAARQRFEV